MLLERVEVSNFCRINISFTMKPKTATRILLSILISFTVFHIGVLLKVVPAKIVWGGRLVSESEIYLFESVSIVVLLYLIFILLMKASVIRPIFSPKVISISLWAFLILFILNTIGNLLSKTITEQSFALLTLVIALLLWAILKNHNHKKADNQP